MSKDRGILDTMKHLVMDDDEEKSDATLELAKHIPMAAIPQVYADRGIATLPVDVPATDDGKVYANLLAKTDFGATVVGSKVQKYVESLNIPGIDTATQYRLAINQAKKLDNLTDADIQAAFTTMKQTLQAEQGRFNNTVESMTAQQVTAREQQIVSISDQIKNLNEQLTKVGLELADAKGKVAHAQSQFSSAFSRRNSEIETQQSQILAYLK